MTIQLYQDQMEVVRDVRAAFSQGHNTLILQSPTGSGKSRMGAYMAANAMAKGSTVLFDVPMKELRKQIGNSFRDLNIEHSYIASGQRYNPFARCFISTTPTIANRLDRVPRINFALIDEGHQGGDGRDRLKSWLRAQGAKILILTATPERLDTKPIDPECDCLVMGKSIRWLIDNKRLSDYRMFTPSRPDLSAIKVNSGGDYNQKDAASFMESQSIIVGDAVRHYQQLAMGKRNVSYCASIKHSQMVCAAFNDAGIPSAHIDGTMSDDERLRIIKAFARREILNICNSDLLLYGFDLAASSGDNNAVVESISDLKPTMSKAMQFQKIGRALRMKPDAAVIMDHASNTFNADGTAKHGLPCSVTDWAWKGREKKGSGGCEKAIPVKQCPVCFFVMKPSTRCISCGHVFEVSGRTPEHVDGELMEVSKDDMQVIAKQERQLQGRADSFEALLELEKRKGAKNGWADRVWTGRGNSGNGLREMRARWQAKQ